MGHLVANRGIHYVCLARLVWNICLGRLLGHRANLGKDDSSRLIIFLLAVSDSHYYTIYCCLL